jgi:hypothetical protein
MYDVEIEIVELIQNDNRFSLPTVISIGYNAHLMNLKRLGQFVNP